MPTLEEVLAIVPAGKVFFIEIKCGTEVLPVLEKTLAKSAVPPENLRIISFNAEVIAQSKQRLPKVKAHWLTDYKLEKTTAQLRPDHETILKTLKETGAAGLGSKANFEMLTPAFVSRLKGMGLEVGAWTVDKPEEATKLREMGASAITTNRPGFIREQLGR
jgi:glycerophosphoryl diester phosphodiesterase